MKYLGLSLGLTDVLLNNLQKILSACNLQFTAAPTIQVANRMLNQQEFQLLIVNLDFLRNIHQEEWLTNVRHSSFLPIVVVSNTPEADTISAIKCGADICVSGKQAHSIIASLVAAQIRRYTEYNHYNDLRGIEAASFRVGDIFIDPARRIVEVQGQQVSLRPREFSLLLYFMQNPDIVLTAEQICENAWGTGGIYEHGVGHPVRLLRQAIEPDPKNPIYIETVYRVGYRFAAKSVEKRRTKLLEC